MEAFPWRNGFRQVNRSCDIRQLPRYVGCLPRPYSFFQMNVSSSGSLTGFFCISLVRFTDCLCYFFKSGIVLLCLRIFSVYVYAGMDIGMIPVFFNQLLPGLFSMAYHALCITFFAAFHSLLQRLPGFFLMIVLRRCKVPTETHCSHYQSINKYSHRIV